MSRNKRNTKTVTKKSKPLRTAIFEVGDKFESYAEFAERLELYKETVFNDYWIRDSRTLRNYVKKSPNGFAAGANPDLMYYSLRLACVKGGIDYTPRNSVRNTVTFRQQCRAAICLRISADAKHLEITELCEDHSHPVSEELFLALPQRRLKIPQELKETAWKLLHAGESKKRVQEKIHEESGCWVTYKDLQNLKKNLFPHLSPPSNSPMEMYKKLLNEWGFGHVKHQFDSMNSIKIVISENNEEAVFKNPDGLLTVRSTHCQCKFFTSMGLPCKHIFKFREECNQPFYDETLCQERWSRNCMTSRCKNDVHQKPVMKVEVEMEQSDNESPNSKKEKLTSLQKLKAMNKECLKLSKLCSEVDTSTFYERVKFIRKLYKHWSKAKDSQHSEDNKMEASNFVESVKKPPACILPDPDEDVEEANFEELVVECPDYILPESSYQEETVEESNFEDEEMETEYKVMDINNKYKIKQSPISENRYYKIVPLSSTKATKEKIKGRSEEIVKTVVGLKRKRI